MPYTAFSLAEAAAYLHMDVRDVRHLALSGAIPCELLGSELVFRRHELKTWSSRRILELQGDGLHDVHRRTGAVIHEHDLSAHTAIVTELCSPRNIEPNLQARTAPSVLRAMMDLAVRTELLYDPADLLTGLREREELCSTGVNGGAALLHPRQHDPYMFEDSFVCIGRAVQPVPFGAPDGSRTDLFFLVCCQDDRIHLHVLSRICMLCQMTDVLAALRAAADAHSMFETVARCEHEVIRVQG